MARRSVGNQRINLDQARNRLALIWFSGALVTVLVVILQGIMGRLSGFADQFFGWFAPTIFPMLALIFGVMGSTMMEEDTEKRTVKRFFFRCSVGLSVVYLVVLLLTLLLEPFGGTHNMQYYNIANYWLSPIQGLVVAALGALFNSRKRTESPATEPVPEKKPRGKRVL